MYVYSVSAAVAALAVATKVVRNHYRTAAPTPPKGLKEKRLSPLDSGAFINNNKEDVSAATIDRPSLRKRFLSKDVPEDLDAIVIGSGPSGLISAALLARVGWRVLVLEQNESAGGGLHVFDKPGGYRFDAGLHYVGASRDDLQPILDEACNQNVDWRQLGSEADGYTYDHIRVGASRRCNICNRTQHDPKQCVKVTIGASASAIERLWCTACLAQLQNTNPNPSVLTTQAATLDDLTISHGFRGGGYDEWVHDLCVRFPDKERNMRALAAQMRADSESKQIRRFFALKAVVPFAWLCRVLQRLLCRDFLRMTRVTWLETLALHGIDADSHLGRVLTTPCGNYGTHPSVASYYMHMAVLKHYWEEGGLYPVGGPEAITSALVRTIRKAGGDVLCQATVTAVACTTPTSRTVSGVYVKGGGRSAAAIMHSIHAGTVISAVGAETSLKFIHPFAYTAVYSHPPPPPSTSMLMLFVGLKMPTARAAALPTYNLWYSTPDPDVVTAEVNASDEDFSYFISFSSLRAKAEMSKTTMTKRQQQQQDEEWDRHDSDVMERVSAVMCVPTNCGKFSDFMHLRKDDTYQTNANYLELKKELTATLLQKFKSHVPEAFGDDDADDDDSSSIEEFIDLGTPCSLKKYLGTSEFGETYGRAFTANRWMSPDTQPRTAIRGLYRTGQDCVTNGLAGAASAAEITVNVVLGYGSEISDLINGRDFIKDLQAWSLYNTSLSRELGNFKSGIDYTDNNNNNNNNNDSSSSPSPSS